VLLNDIQFRLCVLFCRWYIFRGKEKDPLFSRQTTLNVIFIYCFGKAGLLFSYFSMILACARFVSRMLWKYGLPWKRCSTLVVWKCLLPKVSLLFFHLSNFHCHIHALSIKQHKNLQRPNCVCIPPGIDLYHGQDFAAWIVCCYRVKGLCLMYSCVVMTIAP